MKFNKYLIKKEVFTEFRNNSSLYLITPTMTVLIIVFPILAENRFAIDEDLFIIIQILFLILFSTLFSIRNPIDNQKLSRELNFAKITRSEYFINKISSEFLSICRKFYFLVFCIQSSQIPQLKQVSFILFLQLSFFP